MAQATVESRNSRPLFDEKGRFVGYLVEMEGRRPFLTTRNGTPSQPLHTVWRNGQVVRQHVNIAHAARLRAADRLGATEVVGSDAKEAAA